jgi:hypothetical protein
LGNRVTFKQDEDATNPTTINGVRYKERDLKSGDRLEAGKTKFDIKFVGQTPEADSAALDDVGQTEMQSGPAWPADLTPPPDVRPSPLESWFSRSSADAKQASPDTSASEFEIFPQPKTAPAKESDSSDASPRPIISPIDSSLFDSFADSGKQQVFEKRPNSIREFCSLALRTEERASAGFHLLLDALSQRWVVCLAMHFTKAGVSPPDELLEKQLFTMHLDWFPDATGPIVQSWEAVAREPALRSLVPRLCDSDACMAFFSQTSEDELRSRIQGMLRVGLNNFSAEDGFLPVLWPAYFATLVDCSGFQAVDTLFDGVISGAYFRCPSSHKRLIAVADSELANVLEEREFTRVDRILGGQ